MPAPKPNGASSIGLWASVILSAVALVVAIGKVYSVSFATDANTMALDALRSEVRANQIIIRELQSRQATQERDLNEIETQFCGEDIVRNLMHANDLRETSLLWQKVFGVPYPIDNAYYPTICNRKSGQ